jgi:transcriptional regulator with XRE-family HTH domain
LADSLLGLDSISIRSGAMDTSKPIDRLIDRVMAGLGMSRADLATALEVTERAIARWQTGKNYPQYESRARLDELGALADHLRRSFGVVPDGIAWLNAPNDALHGQTPYAALLEDRIDAVERALSVRDRARAA